MRGGWVAGCCTLIVGGALAVGCGGASHRAGGEGAGGTLDNSSSGGSAAVAGTVSAVGGAATSGSGGVAGVATGAGGSTGATAGESGEEPSPLQDGGEGGVAAASPLDWRLELEIIEPTEQQLKAGEGAMFPARTGLIAVNEDGTRALAASTFPGPDLKDGTLELTEIIAWTKDHGSVSLGQLPGLEPAFNSDAPHQFSVRYWASDYTKDLEVVVGSVDGTVADHAFIWREGEGMTELQLPGAPDEIAAQLSDDGKVALVVATDKQRVPRTFRFDSSRTDLGTLPGYDGLEATYMSPDGSRVIGNATSSNCQPTCSAPFTWQLGDELRPFDVPLGVKDCVARRWQKSGSYPILLHCALESDPYVRVVWSEEFGWQHIKGAPAADNAVSFLAHDGSAAIGTSYSSNQVWRWDSTKGTSILSLPQGLTYHDLTAVSDDATTTIIEVENTGYRRIPMSWTSNGELLALPAVPGGPWPTARAMSADASRTVGWVTAVGGRNVLWVDGSAYFIEQLFAQSGIDITGYEYMYADALSRDGHLLSGYFETDDVELVTRGWFARLP